MCTGNKYFRIVSSFINVCLIELQDFYPLDYHDTIFHDASIHSICPGLGQRLRRPDPKIVDPGRAND